MLGVHTASSSSGWVAQGPLQHKDVAALHHEARREDVSQHVSKPLLLKLDPISKCGVRVGREPRARFDLIMMGV